MDVDSKEAAESKAKESAVLCVFTEDDAFEEFEHDTWTKQQQRNEDMQLWQTDWGDTDIHDHFEDLLKRELLKQANSNT